MLHLFYMEFYATNWLSIKINQVYFLSVSVAFFGPTYQKAIDKLVT